MNADIQESDSQFRAAWKHLADRLPGGRQFDMDGIHAVFGGVPIPFFNVLFLEPGSQSEEDLAHRLKEGTRWATEQGLPWLLCVRDDDTRKIVRAQQVFVSAGLQPTMPFAGMIADELRPAAKTVPELKLLEINDARTRQAIVDVNSMAYGMPVGERENLDSERLWDQDAFGVVAYLNGEPVSTAATMLVDGRFYVGWVATVPEHRRKGYADVVMRRSLENATSVHGWRKSVLHATPPGRPVYEKMGYRTVAEYTLYGLGH